MHKYLLIGASIIGVVTAPTVATAQDAAKAYPICTSRGQDSCQNPGEGGAPGRAGSSHRALARHHHGKMHHHGSRGH